MNDQEKIYLLLYISSATDFLLFSFLAYVCDKKLEDFSGCCSRGIMLVRIRFKILTTPSVSYWKQEQGIGIRNKGFISFSRFGPSSHASSLSFPHQQLRGWFVARSRLFYHPLPCRAFLRFSAHFLGVCMLPPCRQNTQLRLISASARNEKCWRRGGGHKGCADMSQLCLLTAENPFTC